MRTNMPVTSTEWEMKDGSSIVSKTDTRGVITYVNAEFIEASGYTERELIGQPHNLVRHPDMPEEAFADLWETLKAGKPWTGIVKNRRKNGDHYWVVANVTPIHENGSLVGYMSARSKPTREQVEAHAAVYRQFKEKRQGNLQIKEGKAIKDSLFRKLNVFARLDVRARLLILIVFLALLLLMVGGSGLIGMRTTLDTMDTGIANDLEPQIHLYEASELIQRNRILIMLGILNPTPENIQKRSEEFEKNKVEISNILEVWEKSAPANDKSKQLIDKFASARLDLVKNGYVPAMAALLAGNPQEATRIANEQISPLNLVLRASMKDLSVYYNSEEVEFKKKSESNYQDALKVLIAAIAGGIILSLVFGLTLARKIAGALSFARTQLNDIAQGRYFNKIDIESDDEIGKLMYAMKSMQIRMGFEVSDAKRIANDALRLKCALDNVSLCVRVANNDGVMIYINNALREVLHRDEAQFKQTNPIFSAANIIGESVGVFYADSAAAIERLRRLESKVVTRMTLGGRLYDVVTTPVVSSSGERLGSAGMWIDQTDIITAEKEVENIVNAAANGDFSQRINLEGKEGFFRQIGQGMNGLMQTSASSLDEVVRVLDALAKGDLTETITNEYHGTFGQLKNDSNTTVAQLTDVIGRIKEAAETINTASKEIASGNTDLSQRTEEQASSLEETAASMEELTSTVKMNSENAKQANQLAAGASEIALRGGEVVSKVVQTMSSISESSKKIVDIISVIDGIAFQTNILALNAAVEAARAGEQGRGFAVVASEVRNLAQRSAAAAKEIKTLINDSVDKVMVGTDLADKAGKTMEEVVNSVKRVTDIMAEISAASVEQSSGIEQVNQAITQMDDVTQQNAALVEEAAAAAESLEEQAQQLSALISTFRLSGERSASFVQRSVPTSIRSSVKRSAVRALPKASSNNDDDWKEF